MCDECGVSSESSIVRRESAFYLETLLTTHVSRMLSRIHTAEVCSLQHNYSTTINSVWP